MGRLKQMAMEEVDRIALEEGLDLSDDEVYQEVWIRACETLVKTHKEIENGKF